MYHLHNVAGPPYDKKVFCYSQVFLLSNAFKKLSLSTPKISLPHHQSPPKSTLIEKKKSIFLFVSYSDICLLWTSLITIINTYRILLYFFIHTFMGKILLWKIYVSDQKSNQYSKSISLFLVFGSSSWINACMSNSVEMLTISSHDFLSKNVVKSYSLI